MANLSTSIDMLKLKGARILSIEIDGKPMNCMVYPLSWNDQKVLVDEAGVPTHCYFDMMQWETNENFRKACLERNADRENYVAPSHEVQVSYSKDFREAACKAAEKRLRADAAFMANNPSEEDIKKKAVYAVNDAARVGYSTPRTPKAPAAMTAAAPAAPKVSGYKAPDANAPVQPEDDLPF